jgi:hypothetical protein
MTRQEGYTIIELLIASAVMLTVVAVVTTLLHDGLIGVPVLEEAGDLHQRTRVAAEAIATEIRSGGAGAEFGRLTDAFASVLPRTLADGPTVATPDVLTSLYVPPHGATSRLLTAFDPGAPTAFIEAVSGCPALVTACGFNTNSRAVVFDGAGGSDVVSVDAIGPGMLMVSDIWGGRSRSYAPGSHIAEVATVTFSLDAATRQLRRLVGAATFTLADNVTELRFQYYDGALAPVPLTAMTDGPFRGSGLTMVDGDLRRVRTVRVTLRLETGTDELRGRDPRLFARPGTADARRMLPDLETTFDVTVRNGGPP